mmetsp:Transcript_4957/g.10442  ORF Transcript_4957/g.10442 Transcript_4957/m.10442 type:complete len:112 (-) Transcript_4957:861-1196(-)
MLVILPDASFLFFGDADASMVSLCQRYLWWCMECLVSLILSSESISTSLSVRTYFSGALVPPLLLPLLLLLNLPKLLLPGLEFLDLTFPFLLLSPKLLFFLTPPLFPFPKR